MYSCDVLLRLLVLEIEGRPTFSARHAQCANDTSSFHVEEARVGKRRKTHVKMCRRLGVKIPTCVDNNDID